jgi:hypothetical protein
VVGDFHAKDANQFKSAFEDAQKTNESRKSGGAAAAAAKDEEGDSESEDEEKETKEETAAAPAPAPAAEDKQTEEVSVTWRFFFELHYPGLNCFLFHALMFVLARSKRSYPVSLLPISMML